MDGFSLDDREKGQEKLTFLSHRVLRGWCPLEPGTRFHESRALLFGHGSRNHWDFQSGISPRFRRRFHNPPHCHDDVLPAARAGKGLDGFHNFVHDERCNLVDGLFGAGHRVRRVQGSLSPQSFLARRFAPHVIGPTLEQLIRGAVTKADGEQERLEDPPGDDARDGMLDIRRSQLAGTIGVRKHQAHFWRDASDRAAGRWGDGLLKMLQSEVHDLLVQVMESILAGSARSLAHEDAGDCDCFLPERVPSLHPWTREQCMVWEG